MPSSYAVDPGTGASHTVEAWLRLYGPEVVGKCPICDEDVKVRAEKSPGVATHFTHQKNSCCPTIEENHEPYRHLRATQKDAANALLVKQWFYDNCYAVFIKCRAYAEGLYGPEFQEMARVACRHDVWSYKGFSSVYVPYVLLTCKDRFPKTPKFRKEEFYFVLAPQLRELPDLWIRPSQYKQKIWKIYPRSHGQFDEFAIDSNLITEPDWFPNTKEKIRAILF